MHRTFREWVASSAAAKRFVLFALILCTAYYILGLINGRAQMADFRVYYDAASSLLNGEAVYGRAFGVSSGFYKYSPFAALAFVPFALLPYALASTLYYLLVTLCVIFWSLYILFYLQKTVAGDNSSRAGWVLFFIAIYMADHIERELHLGNVNLFLLMAAFFSFRYLEKGRERPAGIVYAVILLFKPHFLILVPYFLWERKWKLLLSAVVSVGIGLLIPVIAGGWNFNAQLHGQWLTAMRDHNIELEESPNTVYGIINHFLLAGHGGKWLVILLLALTAALFLWFMIRNQKRTKSERPLWIEYFALIALIPNLAHTDTEHFLWTWPLAAFIVLRLVSAEVEKKWAYVLVFLLAFIPYGLNSPDIVGAELRWLFDEGGLLGLANLVIIAVATILFLREREIVKAA